MQAVYLLYISMLWLSSIFISLITLVSFQYRAVVAFKEYWHLLLTLLLVYGSGYIVVAIYYTVVLIRYGYLPSRLSSKSFPGVMSIISGSAIAFMLAYFVSYVREGGDARNALKRILLKDPYLTFISVLGILAPPYVLLSPNEAVYKSFDGTVTVVFSPIILIVAAFLIVLGLYSIQQLWRTAAESPVFGGISKALRTIGMLLYLQLITGFVSITLASLWGIDAYPVMNVIWVASSFIGIGFFYSEITKPYTFYQLTRLSEADTSGDGKDKVSTNNVLVPAGRRTLVRYSPERDYSEAFSKILGNLAERGRILLIARPTSPLLRLPLQSYGAMVFQFIVSGIIAPSSGALPANNLSLIANTIVNVVRTASEHISVIIDDITELAILNDTRRAYIFLRQIVELAENATIVVLLNPGALSQQDYMLFAGLFDGIISVEESKISRYK